MSAPPLRRVLAATDFSQAATHAVDRAARIAAAHGAVLWLVHGLDGVPAGLVGDAVALPLQRLAMEAAQAALQAERARLAGTVDCRIEVLDPPLQRSLPDLLLVEPAGLVVIGASGRSAWTDLLLGSTAERLLRALDTPVLVVRRADPAPYRRMALATDLSEHSLAAARTALAVFPEVPAWLLHAAEPLFCASVGFSSLPREQQDAYRGASLSAAGRRLAALAATLPGVAGAVQPVLREGPPAQVLPALAREAEVDLVVVGGSLRSPVERTLLGSVSRHAVSMPGCDVLVVPAVGVTAAIDASGA